MNFKYICLILLSFSTTVCTGNCTRRQTKAWIINRTGTKIETLTLSHKYSDTHKHSMTFSNIDHGSVTDTYLTINYHTGFLCVGKD